MSDRENFRKKIKIEDIFKKYKSPITLESNFTTNNDISNFGELPDVEVGGVGLRVFQRMLSAEREHSMQLQAEIKSLRAQSADSSRAANQRIKSLEQENAELRVGRSSNRRDQDCASLGLDPNTAFLDLTEEQIQAVLLAAYRVRARINHPDANGRRDEKEMTRVNIAYNRLKDPKTRGSFPH